MLLPCRYSLVRRSSPPACREACSGGEPATRPLFLCPPPTTSAQSYLRQPMTDEIVPDNLSARKRAIRDLANRQAPNRDRWVARNSFYYEEDLRYMRFLVPEGLKVVDLVCGN